MADLSSIEQSLGTLIISICYPNGIPAGSLPVSPLVGNPVIVERGWPDSDELTSNLAQNIVCIYVNPEKGMSIDKTRFAKNEWKTLVEPVTTITANINNNTISFAGNINAPHLIGILLNGNQYVLQVSASDTINNICNNLVALIPSCSLQSSNSILMPSIPLIKIAGFATIYQDVRRQEQVFRITIFTNDANQRDMASSTIDSAMANMDWINLADGTSGRLRYRDSPEGDESTKVSIWRRDLRYSVEYSTIIKQIAPQILWSDTIYKLPNSLSSEIININI